MAVSDGINRFKRRHSTQDKVKRDLSLSFLTKSPSQTTVVLQKNEWEIIALVVSTYKEGPNEMLLFTFVNTADESLPLQSQRNVYVGDYITYNNKTFLVFDEFDHPDYADYKKHKILECNVDYGYKNKKFGGFYMGSRRKLETLNEGHLAEAITLAQVGAQPLLIAALQTDMKPRQRVMINGEVWMVDNVDRNTIAGVMFLSMHLDSVSTADNIVDNIANSPTAPTIATTMLIAGSLYTIQTHFGYVRFNTGVTILSQSDNEVVIEVPYDINALQITTKSANGEIIIESKEVA